MKYVIALLIFAWNAPAAQLDPNLRFEVMTSPNFEIFFSQGQRKLAERYLVAAETARDLLMPLFREAPDKTFIILRDDTDFSNGMANFLPFPHILIFPVLPSPYDSIDEYGNWPLEMMIHEYTHILNVYSAHGFYRPLSWVFGNLVRPNAVLPRWYLEGLAVDLESRLTAHGRLRSPETRAAARALVLEGRLKREDIARINESDISSWPFGGRPYLYGGWWWDHVHRQKGDALIYNWNQTFSRRLPFLLNEPVREQTGKSVAENLSATFASLEDRANKELEILKSNPHPIATNITEESGEQTVFSVSPSGKHLLYWLWSPGQGAQARLKTRSANAQAFQDCPSVKLFQSAGSSTARWVDEDHLILDQVDLEHPYRDFRDLYEFDIPKRRWRRLTFGARASEPALSPSKKQIAFIQSDAGKNHLALLDRASGKTRRIVRGRLDYRLSSPEFLSDSEILFIQRAPSGFERIYIYDLRSHLPAPWPGAKFEHAQRLRRTDAGLMVTDASGGVRNLYLRDTSGEWAAITNTLTDVISGDFDPQKQQVLISELSAQGRRLRATDLSKYNPAPLEPVDLPQAPPAVASNVEIKNEKYQPLAYMWPRYWVPFIFQVENGFIMQGLTTASDPVGRNRYSLLGSYDTVTKKASYGANYTNRSLPTAISVHYNKAQNYLGASALTIENQSAGATLSKPLLQNRNLNGQLGAEWLTTETSTLSIKRMGPSASVSYSRLTGPLVDRIGVHGELAHSEFIFQEGFLAYGRTYAHGATNIKIGKAHRLSLQGRAAVAPKLPLNRVVTLGDRNLGGNYLVNLANSQFLLRGYPSGAFVGRKMISANAEFILPASELDRGYGILPLFLKNLEIALFADGLSTDGAGYATETNKYMRSHLSEYYVGSGAELRFSATAAYHMPISLTLGLYYGLNDRFGGGFSPFLGIGLGDLSALSF